MKRIKQVLKFLGELIIKKNPDYGKPCQKNSNDLLQLMHDTMSPVATIKGSVTLLKTGTCTPEETIKMLDAITDRADKLNEVLDSYYIKQRAK